MKVFWSWQSDTPAKCNKDFVKEALQRALEQVSDELGLTEAERPEVDHDTKGVPGLVAIVDEIFKKIEQADAFVGDVTFVGSTPKNHPDDKVKLLPNPNVLIELGHALTSVGHQGIILVANTAFGGAMEDLPFDLRHRRGPILYTLKADATPEKRARALEKLSEALVEALRLNLGAALAKHDAKAQIILHPSREGDRSIWLQPGEPLRHQDTFFAAGEREWTVPEKPRSYLRVTPAEWTVKPTRSEVLTASSNLFALGPWQHGNYGANELGVVKIGFGSGSADEAVGATQWIHKTGEIWGFNCAATMLGRAGRLHLCLDSLAREWDDFLRCVLAVLDRMGAHGPIRVEAGVTGMKDVYWPDETWGPARALETEVHTERTHRDWTADKRRDFLVEIYNKLHDAFGKPKVAPELVPRSR